MTRRNSSGIVGVRARHETTVKDGRSYNYSGWAAKWPECPRRGGIAFSVTKYGDDDAFVLAALAIEFQSVDRKWLEKKLNKISIKKYKSIVSKKGIDFVD